MFRVFFTYSSHSIDSLVSLAVLDVHVIMRQSQRVSAEIMRFEDPHATARKSGKVERIKLGTVYERFSVFHAGVTK